MARLARVKAEDSGAFYHLCGKVAGASESTLLMTKGAEGKSLISFGCFLRSIAAESSAFASWKIIIISSFTWILLKVEGQ
jgi:hypothetical protein